MYGATVSTNIYDSSQYVWKGGRLTGIYWNNKSVYGDIDLNHFSFLEEFVCHGNSEEFGVNRSTGNYIFSIDANDCSNLKVIVCDGGFLRELYAENADNLQQVELDSTPVQVLDLSSAANLYNLELSDDTMIKILRVSSDVDKETVAKWNIKYISDSIERVK
jgi:hypothetical protein